jgi:hypothetical protein
VPIKDGVPASCRERAHVPPDPDVDRAMGGSLELPGLGVIHIAPRSKGRPEEEPGRARLEDVAAHDGRVISDSGRRILGRAAAGEEDTWLLQNRTRGLLRERAGRVRASLEIFGRRPIVFSHDSCAVLLDGGRSAPNLADLDRRTRGCLESGPF